MRSVIRSFCQAAVLLGALSAGPWAGPSVAAGSRGSPPAAAKLQALRSRIDALTSQVARGLKQRDELSAALRDAELAIPAQREALAAVQRERAEVDERRTALDAERVKVQAQLDARRAALARAARLSYELGREPSLKLLLNQQRPAAVGRVLAYHAYVGRAQQAGILAIQADLARLQKLDQQIREQGARLGELDEQARRQLASLEAARSQRAAALSALNRRVDDANQQIGKLKRDEQALESLLADLNKIAPDYDLGARQPFAKLRGKLPWPVQGRIAARFAQSRGGAEAAAVRWNGLLIEADPGAKVRAPYHGRVIYSDWLQGMGLLLIIEHGGGYLTLFGHAEILYKRVGDSVAPGEVIGALSDAGRPQLYFEIRHGRTALDPQQWLKAQRR
jgi:murein hydrolase activator